MVAGAVAFLALGGIEWIKGTIRKVAFSDNPTAISAASQSVVKLNCYDKNGDLYATGSGFACFADNVIVTNYHVIENAYKIEIIDECDSGKRELYQQMINAQHDVYHHPNKSIWLDRPAYLFHIEEVYDNSATRDGFGTKMLYPY